MPSKTRQSPASGPRNGAKPGPAVTPRRGAKSPPTPAAPVCTPDPGTGPALGRLADFRPLVDNPNQHTERGLGLLESAIQQDGYTAPMTAAADGTILDGNARLETVAHALPADPIVVRHDGTRPIIAIRTDIPSADDPRARRIAIGANRIAEVDLQWNLDVLRAQPAREAIDAGHLWTARELANLLGEQRKGRTDPDDVPPERATDIRRGDLFELGQQACCPHCGEWSDVDE